MTYTKKQVFQAFKQLHNGNDDGDIYLPSDQPEELLVEESVIDAGCWVKNCNVWISTEQIESGLKLLKADKEEDKKMAAMAHYMADPEGNADYESAD